MNDLPKTERPLEFKDPGQDLAFPGATAYENLGLEITRFVGTGMTKREYFAAFAMQAYINYSLAKLNSFEEVAEYAVNQADALIAQLAAPRDEEGNTIEE
jgi:hypothetical protein